MDDTAQPREFSADELRESLDGVLREIADATSIGAVVSLMRDFGGTRLHIPSAPPPGHKIVKSLGRDAACELCSAFGGCDLYIPKRDVLTRAIRNRKIVAAYDSGASVSDLARKFNLSYRSIHTILNSPD